jgi:homoserine trans-succinylase
MDTGAMLLQPLHDALDVLSAAVEGDDHGLTQQLMDDYNAQVGRHIAAHDAEIGADALRDLIAHQQQIGVRMAARRDEAAVHLNADRRAVRASLAYLRAESLS